MIVNGWFPDGYTTDGYWHTGWWPPFGIWVYMGPIANYVSRISMTELLVAALAVDSEINSEIARAELLASWIEMVTSLVTPELIQSEIVQVILLLSGVTKE